MNLCEFEWNLVERVDDVVNDQQVLRIRCGAVLRGRRGGRRRRKLRGRQHGRYLGGFRGHGARSLSVHVLYRGLVCKGSPVDQACSYWEEGQQSLELNVHDESRAGLRSDLIT